MTKIVYNIRNGFYECTELLSEKGEGGILIVCPKETTGEISLKGTRKKLENATVKFDTPPLDNQIIEPLLHKGRKNIPLERIYFSGGVALTLPKSDGYVKALSELVGKQQKVIEELTARIDKLDSAVFGTNFF